MSKKFFMIEDWEKFEKEMRELASSIGCRGEPYPDPKSGNIDINLVFESMLEHELKNEGKKNMSEITCSNCDAFNVCEKVTLVYHIFHSVPSKAKYGEVFNWSDLFVDPNVIRNKIFKILGENCKIRRKQERRLKEEVAVQKDNSKNIKRRNRKEVKL